MNFTFGIISNNAHIESIIQSIYDLNIPEYEIIIVGKAIYSSKNNIIHFDFDEGINNNWITKKKNIIINLAKFENIVLLHDYFVFNKDWYEGFLKFGNDWNLCVCKILTPDNKRFRDYLLFPYYPWWNKISFNPYNKCLLPYNIENNEKLNKFMYVSGGFYIIKKQIALKYPLNEKLLHCQGEDVELFLRLANNNIIVKCNKYSTVQATKNKPQADYFNNELTLIDVENLLNQINNIEPDFFNKNLFYNA
jgi:hypothetical protein